LCKKYDLHPNRSNGQNFLIDKNILDKIVVAGELGAEDTILEIGPGFGVLTQELVKRAGKVVAVEKDKRLAEFLRKEIKKLRNKEVKGENNLEIVNEDILKINLAKIDEIPASAGMTSTYKIISNLPYQITAPVLWRFLHEEKEKPKTMVLMVQKEVGERICARPGKMSILSVLCQLYAECEIVTTVSRNCFWPAPEVDSVIIKLEIRNLKLKNIDNNLDYKELMRIVKIGFSAKRKMLKNNLAGGLQVPMEKVVAALQEVGLDVKIRAQELRVEDWINLYRNFLVN